MSARKPELQDYPDICSRLQELQCGDTLVSRMGSIPKILEAIRSGSVDSAVIDEEYLLVYSFGEPWYSSSLVLEELMVLRIREGTVPLSAVTEYLEQLADEYAVDYTIVGGALSSRPAVLRRAYMQQGFTPCDFPVLYKER